MNPELQKRLYRIQKVAKTIKVICKVLIGFLLFYYLVMVIVMIGKWGLDHIGYGHIRIEVNQLTPGATSVMILLLRSICCS